jgi:hypothetical protein
MMPGFDSLILAQSDVRKTQVARSNYPHLARVHLNECLHSFLNRT